MQDNSGNKQRASASMSEAKRRRSSRLICSPWLNKGTKRPPVHVDLDTEQRCSVVDKKARHRKDSSVEELEITFTRNINWGSGLGSLRKPESKDSKLTNVNVGDGSDDDDFVTPLEKFGSISTVNEGGTSNSRRKTKGNSNNQAIVVEANTTAQQRTTRSMKKNAKRNDRKKTENVLGTKNQYAAKGEAVGCKEAVINEKPPEKKVRSYENYIQRKFRPAIMREVLISLSEEQVAWVKRTGFGGILDVRMEKYPHRMGYNVVAAFNAEECMLSMKAGNIKITEDIVHNIIGLPKGNERVIISKDKGAYDFWGLQFPGTLTCKVNGEFHPFGSNDVLITALETPEHSGRVRVFGGFISPKSYFNLPRQRRITKDELLARDKQRSEELQKTKEELIGEIAKLRAMIAARAKLVFEDAQKEIMAENEIMDIDPPPPSNKMLSQKCELAVDNIENKVAFGVIFKDGTRFSNKIHGVDMMPGCVWVSVDGCINPKALLPIPVPGEMETLIQAIGSHVAWPDEFIIYQDSEPSQWASKSRKCCTRDEVDEVRYEALDGIQECV
ncbi:hypothetical protein DCAR_0101160 [Daucus carota subsp. sativus]|uniref:DUF8039 domain-containing protein n=1 Tax=Daucus carota subsp. sativus TaxID=79200 RepID=A0A166G6L3_DAUCS|nr:hypothetical protein DCAR_0101160 [Daucus carota subsp. sativus]